MATLGQMSNVMFDIDGTLIDNQGKPRQKIVDMYRKFQEQGANVGAWSRQGPEHAKATLRSLGLTGNVVEKGSYKPDVAVDNEEHSLGQKNIAV